MQRYEGIWGEHQVPPLFYGTDSVASVTAEIEMRKYLNMPKKFGFHALENGHCLALNK